MAKRFFNTLLKFRWFIIAIYIVLIIPAAYYASQVRTDNSLDRMVVPGEKGKVVFDRFRKVFGSDEFMLIALEGKEIFSESFLLEAEEVERQLQQTPNLAHSRSLISIFRQIHPMFNAAEEDWRKQFRHFSLSSSFFNYQGLIAPDRMLTIILQLKTATAEQRRDTVKFVTATLEPFKKKDNAVFRSIRVVGQPNINYEMDRSSMEIGAKFFPIYLLFAMGLLWFLYRSFRGLFSVLITLGVSLAFAVAAVTLSGSVLTLVSSVMPMMVMVVTIETIIHIYSGYVRPPEGIEMQDHLVNILDQKWKACWFSVFTTSVGFGSFVFSPVMPIRDLGIFVAFALVVSYIVCFTLFPILLYLVPPPTGRAVKSIGLQMFDPILSGLPTYTYWWRKSLVPVMTIVGAIAIHSFFNMEMETNTLNYLNDNNQLKKDTLFIEDNLIGLLSVEVVLEGKDGLFSKPDTLRKLQDFERTVNRSPDVQSVLSASTMLRMANFVENGKDDFPRSNFSVSKYILALSQQNMWDSFVSPDFNKLRISTIVKNVDFYVFDRLDWMLKRVWKDFVGEHPEFKDVKLVLTGMAPLTANITRFLLDTLISSFGLTLLIVFGIFLLEIRRVTYALIAMLPSLFAILLMYMAMTIAEVKLDIGSIMIAAVVLGISVDATIHFFQHLREKQKEGASMEESLDYTLLIAGRAIIVSTVVIFSGFVTFSFSDFPPIRNFGILTSLAIIFSLVGTMVYLPACLWLMAHKEKPAHIDSMANSRFSILPPPPPGK